MKCSNPECPYCNTSSQKLEIFFRVRMPWRIHAELRARHKNVSAYIRDLILADLHINEESQLFKKNNSPSQEEAVQFQGYKHATRFRI
jgi:hypothetical protein